MAQSIARPREDRATIGILMMLAAWFFFALVDTSVKWLVLAGVPAVQLAFLRYVVAFALSVGAAAATDPGAFRRPEAHMGLLLLRGGLLVSATFFNFYALQFLSLTVTSAIMFSAPILVCALAVPLLGEQVGPWRWFAIVLGFAGVLIVIRPFGEAFHWTSLLILYNATALALFSIITRKLSGVISPETMQLYMGGVGTLALLPWALWAWQTPQSGLGWALVLSLGVWAWIGHEFFARAHRFAEAGTLMPYSYTFLIYLTVASYALFGEVPDGYTGLGAFVIVASGLLIWWRENLRTAHMRDGAL